MEVAVVVLVFSTVLFAFWAFPFLEDSDEADEDSDDIDLEGHYQYAIGEVPLYLDGRYD